MDLSSLFRPNVAKLREKGDYRGLIHLLDSAIYQDRDEAYFSLVQAGTEAVGALIAALRSRSAMIREQAARLLGEIGDARAAAPLHQLLREDAQTSVRTQAAASLGCLPGGQDPALLVAALSENTSQVRKAVRQTLVRLGPRAMPALLDGMHSASNLVRASCTWALTDISDPRAFDALCSALRDPEWAVRNNAVVGLGALGDPRASKCIVRLLRDPEMRVRAAAAIALRSVGDGSILTDLLILAESSQGTDDAREARITLTKLAAAWDLAAVQVELENPNLDIRKAALEILVERKWDPAQGTPLQQAIFWASLHQWERCAALGEVALGPLIEQFGEVQTASRVQIIQALGKISSPRAIAPLVQQCYLESVPDHVAFYAKEPNWLVVTAVVEALLRIGVPALSAFKTIAIQLRHESNLYRLCEIIEKSATRADTELLLALLAEGGEPFAEYAGRALESLADPAAIRPLLKLYPQDPPYFLIRLLGKVGDAQCVDLLTEMYGLASEERKRETVLHALAECTHWQVCQPILEFMFGLRGPANGINVWSQHLPHLKELFGDGIELILRAATVGIAIDYEQSTHEIVEDGPDFFTRAAYVRTLKIDMPAIMELRKQVNPLTDNLLQIISVAANHWLNQYGSVLGWEQIISLKTLMEEELEKRGYPAYDPRVYMHPYDWVGESQSTSALTANPQTTGGIDANQNEPS